MKNLLLAAALTVSAHALPAFVQANQCNTGSFSCTIALTVTAGNSLFVSIASGRTAPTFTVSDGVNTYSIAESLFHWAGSVTAFSTEGFYAVGISGGATTITCQTSDNTDSVTCVAAEFSGASVVDQTSTPATTSNTGAAGSASAGTTGATTAANEIVFATYHASSSVSSWTNGTGYTIPTNGSQVVAGAASALEYKVVSSTGAQTDTITEGVQRDTIGQIVTFKAAGGGGAALMPPVIY